MQPKRDPNDRRYWPARLGGTGQGFTRQGKAESPAYYGALNRGGSLSPAPRPTRVTPDTVADDTKLVDIEAVRARARLVSLRLLDRLENVADSMDTGETVDALNATGKLTGAIDRGQGGNVTLNLGSLHLAALQAVKPALPSATVHLIEGAEVVDVVPDEG